MLISLHYIWEKYICGLFLVLFPTDPWFDTFFVLVSSKSKGLCERVSSARPLFLHLGSSLWILMMCMCFLKWLFLVSSLISASLYSLFFVLVQFLNKSTSCTHGYWPSEDLFLIQTLLAISISFYSTMPSNINLVLFRSAKRGRSCTSPKLFLSWFVLIVMPWELLWLSEKIYTFLLLCSIDILFCAPVRTPNISALENGR